jgi:hypothetical protein
VSSVGLTGSTVNRNRLCWEEARIVTREYRLRQRKEREEIESVRKSIVGKSTEQF